MNIFRGLVLERPRWKRREKGSGRGRAEGFLTEVTSDFVTGGRGKKGKKRGKKMGLVLFGRGGEGKRKRGGEKKIRIGSTEHSSIFTQLRSWEGGKKEGGGGGGVVKKEGRGGVPILYIFTVRNLKERRKGRRERTSQLFPATYFSDEEKGEGKGGGRGEKEARYARWVSIRRLEKGRGKRKKGVVEVEWNPPGKL